MSKFETRDMSGHLFKNERREKDTHPNATGTAMIDGVLYRVSAWTKEGKKGRFQSLSFKREQSIHDDPSEPKAGEPHPRDEEIPW